MFLLFIGYNIIMAILFALNLKTGRISKMADEKKMNLNDPRVYFKYGVINEVNEKMLDVNSNVEFKVLSGLEFELKFMNAFEEGLKRKKTVVMPIYVDHVKQCRAFPFVDPLGKSDIEKENADVIFVTPMWSDGVMNLDICWSENVPELFGDWKQCKEKAHRIESVSGYATEAGKSLRYHGWTCPDCGKWYKIEGKFVSEPEIFEHLEAGGHEYRNYSALLFSDFLNPQINENEADVVTKISESLLVPYTSYR